MAKRTRKAPLPDLTAQAGRDETTIEDARIADARIENARMALARKIARFTSDWRACPQRACLRHRRCETRDAVCLSPRVSPQARTVEDSAALFAALKRALDAARAAQEK